MRFGARLAARSAGCAGLLALFACSAAPAPAGRVGASIALLSDGRLAVCDPDQGSVSFVDPQSLATLATIEVGGDPRALVQLGSGALWVATHHGGEVVAIEPATAKVTARTQPCAGPVGLAESPDGAWVAVACEWSGSVLRLDPVAMTSTVVVSGLHRPRSVAVVGESVLAAEFIGGDVIEVDGDGETRSVSLVPTEAPYRPALTRMTANLAAAVVPAFGHVFVPHELVEHTGDDEGEVVADDYGTVIAGTPKINAAVSRLDLDGETLSASSDTPPVYSRFDATTHAFSGPVAAAPFGDRFLLVAHVSTNDVAVLDTEATDPDQRLVATYEVGAGPSGIAVDQAHQLAFVDNALDGSISRIDLSLPHDATAPSHPAMQTAVRGLPSPYSAAALAGRKLFFDATNPHVTPARVVACASCHPNGDDDGLVWFMHTPSIPLKRRRTPNLANAKSQTAPFHWDGSFANMTDLVNGTITGLMGGDGLLVDGSTVQAFVDEIVKAPEPPPQDPAAVERGRTIFESQSAGCASCHAGAELTDGANHAVLSPMSLTDDDAFTEANTPDLHGLFERAPYLHDGRASTLMDLLTRQDARAHGNTASLSPGDLSDLVAYLNSL